MKKVKMCFFLLFLIVATSYAQKSGNLQICKITVGEVDLYQQAPKAASIGEEFRYRLRVKARKNVTDVVVKVYLPQEVSHIRHVPPTENIAESPIPKFGKILVWKFDGMMEAGQTKNISVWAKAKRQANLLSCATVSSTPMCCTPTFVGKPILEIVKTARRKRVVKGDSVTFDITVKNVGSSVAKAVKIIDKIPNGLVLTNDRNRKSFSDILQDPNKDVSVYNLGSIEPLQSKSIALTFRTTKRGQLCNTAIVSASNVSGEVKSTACIYVIERKLEIKCKLSNRKKYVNRLISGSLSLTNTGNVSWKNLIIEGSSTLANGSSSRNIRLLLKKSHKNRDIRIIRQGVWRLPKLKPGETRKIDVVTIVKSPGNYCLNFKVREPNSSINIAQTNCCAEWFGIPAVVLELIDHPDPISIYLKEKIVYTVRATNQSKFRRLENVRMKITFPKEITSITNPKRIKRYTGPYDTNNRRWGERKLLSHRQATARYEGESIILIPPQKILNIGEYIEFEIPAKPFKNIVMPDGQEQLDVLIKLELTADNIGETVNETENTTLY